jgi:hypothetical protein
VIKAVYITGDFFCDDAAVATLERALRWHPADPARVAATLAAEPVALPHVPVDALATVIDRAVEAARCREQLAVAKGCFVDP